MNQCERDEKSEKRKHPPGLTGREIGMFYRNLTIQNKKNKKHQLNAENEIQLGPNVSVPKEILKKVKEHLARSEIADSNDRLSNRFSNYCKYIINADFYDILEKAHCVTSNVEFPAEEDSCEPTDVESSIAETEISVARAKLPVYAVSKKIIEAIKKNQVVLIAGSTGCGKTTQIPQLLLNTYIQEQCANYDIVCTQPRRISAISIAERVADERGESLGASVGYQIRLQKVLPKRPHSILYCTTGILLEKMRKDPLLRFANAVFLDEIHERSVETDLLMGIIKKILPYRPDLRVILMSATLREQDFRDYFDDCKMFYVEGTLFPVTVCYIEDIIQETGFKNFKQKQNNTTQIPGEEKCMDYKNMITPYIRKLRGQYSSHVLDALQFSDSEGCANLQFLEFLIFYICKNKPPGSILVFLPGYDKISKLHASLRKPTQSIAIGMENKIQVHVLHSRIPAASQKSVFRTPPNGIRKIILSTNIAETSITIDDVVYVINSGRAKVSQYNVQNNIQTLEEVWVSTANTQQRKGRAGRVQPGICYNLFTKAREAIMPEIPTPEILCTKLDSIILNLKLMYIRDVRAFMSTLLTTPDFKAIENSTNLLKRIGALEENECLTPLGIHLGHLPIDPQIAKMVLMSALFRCFDPITTIAAVLSFKSPFNAPLGKEKVVDKIKLELSESSRSDHLLNHKVLQKYRESYVDGRKYNFCVQNFLSLTTLEEIERMKKQFSWYLKSVRYLESTNCAEMKSNRNSNNTTLLRAVIAAGLYPNMAFLRKVRRIKNKVMAIHTMSTPEENRVNFHTSSVNFGISSFDSHYFVYFQKQKSNGVNLMDATMIFPMALIIFGDGIEVGVTKHSQPYISVANAYFFKCDTETHETVLQLRNRLQWLMLKKALYPSPIEENSNEEEIVKAILLLLSYDAYADMEPFVDSVDNEVSDEDE